MTQSWVSSRRSARSAPACVYRCDGRDRDRRRAGRDESVNQRPVQRRPVTGHACLRAVAPPLTPPNSRLHLSPAAGPRVPHRGRGLAASPRSGRAPSWPAGIEDGTVKPEALAVTDAQRGDRSLAPAAQRRQECVPPRRPRVALWSMRPSRHGVPATVAVWTTTAPVYRREHDRRVEPPDTCRRVGWPDRPRPAPEHRRRRSRARPGVHVAAYAHALTSARAASRTRPASGLCTDDRPRNPASPAPSRVTMTSRGSPAGETPPNYPRRRRAREVLRAADRQVDASEERAPRS
jgi:hypothetical protein